MTRHTVPTEYNDILGLIERLFRWPGLIFDTVRSKLVGVGFATGSGLMGAGKPADSRDN